MENKERFVRAIARWQNYNSHKETKNNLLERAFGSDTIIFDYDGVDEILNTVIDMACLMFPNISEDSIKDNIEYYCYEAVDMKNPAVSYEDGKEFVLNSSEVLYDMFEYLNSL